MKKFIFITLALVALAGFASCGNDGSSSDDLSFSSFFNGETLSFDITSDPKIVVSVLRLGKSGNLTVNLTSSGSSEFTVPSSVVIEDGNRYAEIEITYDENSLVRNEVYTLALIIGDFDSIYGYGTITLTITYPTSFYEYGTGTIVEGWWGETEEKTMYARDNGNNILYCYLPDCWGYESGEGYDVQDYCFYWDTTTDLLYVPVQYMGTDNWCIADRGAADCMFNGDNYTEGSAEWMDYIDSYYTTTGYVHPYYDDSKGSFYLSDTAALDDISGEVVYGTAGTFDVFTLD